MQNIPVVKQVKNEIYADSRDVAEYFGKMHKHVLDSINDCINDCPNLVAEFSAAKYKNRGKDYQCYRMTKTGFTFLVMGYTGEKAAEFKFKYIQRFNDMEQSIKQALISRQAASIDYLPMSEALTQERLQEGKETASHHYSNEANMINRIILGLTSSAFRTENSLAKDDSIRDHLTELQLKAIVSLQRANTAMIEMGQDYNDRKAALERLYSKKWGDKLIEEVHRIEA